MSTAEEVLAKIKYWYGTGGGIDNTAELFLALASVNHQGVKAHAERVALMAEATAKKLEKDERAAFYGGLFHDIGKIILPADLFDGHEINDEEYALIKKHTLFGFQILKDLHEFTALCAGLHHVAYKSGYGLKIEDLPREWGLNTIKKVLEISVIISICDFADAFTNRKTTIKNKPNNGSGDLRKMLQVKYPNDHQIIENVLEVLDENKW